MLKFENEIMGDAPQSVERRLILPTLEGMSFGDLRYIADSIAEYAASAGDVGRKREERIAELKAHMAEDQAALAELQPQPAKMVNPSTPKISGPGKAGEHLGRPWEATRMAER